MMFNSLSPRQGGGASGGASSGGQAPTSSPFPAAHRGKLEKQQSNNFLSILEEEKEGEDQDDSLNISKGAKIKVEISS